MHYTARQAIGTISDVGVLQPQVYPLTPPSSTAPFAGIAPFPAALLTLPKRWATVLFSLEGPMKEHCCSWPAYLQYV